MKNIPNFVLNRNNSAITRIIKEIIKVSPVTKQICDALLGDVISHRRTLPQGSAHRQCIENCIFHNSSFPTDTNVLRNQMALPSAASRFAEKWMSQTIYHQVASITHWCICLLVEVSRFCFNLFETHKIGNRSTKLYSCGILLHL